MENYTFTVETTSVSEEEKKKQILAFLRSFSQVVVEEYMPKMKVEEPKKIIKK